MPIDIVLPRLNSYEGRYNDEKIDMLFGIQPNVLDEYLVSMSKYQDTHSILNDGWH